MVGRIAACDDERLISKAEREAVSSRTRRYVKSTTIAQQVLPRR